MDRDSPNGRPQWRFTVFAQDEGGNGLVGYADVQVNLKDINDNAPLFPQGMFFLAINQHMAIKFKYIIIIISINESTLTPFIKI